MNECVNDSSKPLIFLGSSVSMYKQTEICDMMGIEIFGIIDNDYFGNTDSICDVAVIDSHNSFDDPAKLKFYKENFNFFCAVNWTPELDPVSTRNRQKRKQLIDLIDQHQLNCVSIVDPRSRISKHSKIGRGCFVDGGVSVEHQVTVDDFVNIYSNTNVGHGSYIGRNCVIQRQCLLAADSYLENDVFFSVGVTALKRGARYGSGSFVHEAIYIRRGTVPDETVSLQAGNPRRVVGNIIE